MQSQLFSLVSGDLGGVFGNAPLKKKTVSVTRNLRPYQPQAPPNKLLKRDSPKKHRERHEPVSPVSPVAPPSQAPRAASPVPPQQPHQTPQQFMPTILRDLQSAVRETNNNAVVALLTSVITYIRAASFEVRTKAQTDIARMGILNPILSILSLATSASPQTRNATFSNETVSTTLRLLAILSFSHPANRKQFLSRRVVEATKQFLKVRTLSRDVSVRRNALALLNNLAGSLDTHERILANNGAAEILARVDETEEDPVAQQAIALLRNLAFNDKLRSTLVTEGAVGALNSALDRWQLNKKDFAAIDITLAIACLVGADDPTDSFETNQDIIDAVVASLAETIKDLNREKKSYVVWKLCMSLSKLALNDQNKKYLNRAPLLYESLHRALTWKVPEGLEDDHHLRIGYTLDTLCNLAFHRDIAVTIAANKPLMETVRKLRWSVTGTIAAKAAGCLFAINMHTEEDDTDELRRVRSAEETHVMVSYCWEQQAQAVRIKEHLEALGVRVWIDVEKVSGSILESMSSGVENAHCVLLCISEAYKHSTNCRLEAEYSLQKKKRTIPLLFQQNYVPDGWLGMLVGTKLWFDFSDVKSRLWKENIATLKREIEKKNVSTDSQQQQVAPLASSSSRPPTATSPHSPTSASATVFKPSSGGESCKMCAENSQQIQGIMREVVEIRNTQNHVLNEVADLKSTMTNFMSMMQRLIPPPSQTPQVGTDKEGSDYEEYY